MLPHSGSRDSPQGKGTNVLQQLKISHGMQQKPHWCCCIAYQDLGRIALPVAYSLPWSCKKKTHVWPTVAIVDPKNDGCVFLIVSADSGSALSPLNQCIKPIYWFLRHSTFGTILFCTIFVTIYSLLVRANGRNGSPWDWCIGVRGEKY